MEMHGRDENRRRYLWLVIALAGALALVAAGCGGDDEEDGQASTGGTSVGDGKVLWESSSVDSDYPSVLTVKAEADPQIPEKEVKLVQAPFNDHSYGSIGIEKGWFKESGISVTPEPNGTILVMDQVAPALLSGQVDVGSMASSIWLGAMDQTTDNKMFTYADVFIGHAILGNPKSGYKTFKEFTDEGMSFDEAIKASLEQIKGKSYAYPSETSQRPFQNYAFGKAGMKLADTKAVVVDDPKVVELATAGRVEAASPVGGPNVVQLLKLGWVPLVSKQELIASGEGADLEATLLSSGWAATNDWLAENHDTALRLASLMYRIIDYKKEEPEAAAAIQIPFLNSIAGTNFTTEDAVQLDTLVDPFFTFEEQEDFFVNTESPWYFRKGGEGTIADAEKSGVLKPGHDMDEIILADDTWRELGSLKEASDELIATVEGEGPSGQAQEYLDQAKAYSEARNYLDALRFAGAAELALES